MIATSVCIGYGLLMVSEILPLIHGIPNGMLHSLLVLAHSIGDCIARPSTREFIEDIEKVFEETETLLEQLPVSSSSSYLKE